MEENRRKKFVIKIKKEKWWKYLIYGTLVLCSIITGIFLGAFLAYEQGLPPVSALEEFKPNIITTVYSDNGEVIGEFALEKRIEISYEEIPDILKKAILAAEDPKFYRHFGIDIKAIIRSIKVDLLAGKPLQGGSTITQQLARLLFLTREKTIKRKIREILLALKIERKYSKKKIFTLYCNQIPIGPGIYGVEAASRYYFGKSAKDLNLEESALIAGLPRSPGLYSPYKHPERALRRRNWVLKRMVEEKFISEEIAKEAMKKPLNVIPPKPINKEFAAYFLEEVRKYIVKKYGTRALYKNGLKVYTTLNIKLQEYAEKALKKGLHELDKRQGWRKDKKNLLKENNEIDLNQYWLNEWKTEEIKEGNLVHGIVLDVSSRLSKIRVKDYIAYLTPSGARWTGITNLRRLIKAGDIILVKIMKIDEEKKILKINLDQEPLVEGAIIAIEPQTGEIKAMVGGYSFKRSEFNRATQALRQTGSAIKPIIYTAALDHGYTPASIIWDEPTTFFDQWTGEPWSPENYDQKYKGAVTLRKGLEESRNIVTAKLLESITPQVGVQYAKKFGITSPLYPYLSFALGSFETSLLEMTSAYCVFPNKGVRVKPFFIKRIEDKEGNILEEQKIESYEVISPQTAFIMTYLMQGVIQRGTAVLARDLDKVLAGKTGTTDEYTDAWFIGFSPSLCAGVWVGFDVKKTLGKNETGARAALPIWKYFFEQIFQDDNNNYNKEEEFEVPPNIVFVKIDRKTGLLASPHCLYTIDEAFVKGTEPKRYCTIEDHLMVYDYYELNKEKEIH
ncbi:PBP1A family penicillin-binding protein [SCandidatus Aminicenantes bacterium Aminicenantia_JdfR_composite]|nr:PBP1A family penicillin-binding protein [SCandidatus Aminicenantes bacterium Aminicenantia_JdfR_composite]